MPLAPHVVLRITILVGLFVALHLDILTRLVRFGLEDGDWSHLFLLPLLSGYFIYEDRHRIAAARRRTFWPALPLLLLCIAAYGLGLHPLRSDMVKGYAMVGSLLALTLLLAGPAPMRYLGFPIAILAMGVKIAPPLWEAVTWRMQLLAAHAGVWTLDLLGYGVELTDNTTIHIQDGPERIALSVAQACSGMRMLMAFLTLGLAMAYLGRRPLWARAVLFLSALPVAILSNVLRVVLLASLTLVDVRFAQGQTHTLLGMATLVPGLLMLMLVGWILEKLAGDRKLEEEFAERGRVTVNKGTGIISGDNEDQNKTSAPFYSPAFAAAVFALLTATIALHGAMLAMGWHFIKRPAELRQPLYLFPKTLGPYEQVGEESLSSEMVEELGDPRYLLRVYRDTRLPLDSPGSLIRLYIGHHTGWADSTPHVGERWILRGVEARGDERAVVHWAFTGPYRFASKDTSYRDPVAKLYLSNSQRFIDLGPLIHHLTSPTISQGYWCEIEVQFLRTRSPDEAEPLVQQFLSQAMPVIEGMLPPVPAVRASG